MFKIPGHHHISMITDLPNEKAPCFYGGMRVSQIRSAGKNQRFVALQVSEDLSLK
ncbi:hypothetical protein [Lederbergia citrea]|uniref:hypothetical protein n=1 Tax=Lederbergia citrea TaxID=2833581 RepID=UPI001BCA0319|nr:hypothetical protein [Lederbergia citrea]MBS4178441.1 hypothetical protein [Lederbergia citrea]